ncbi:MAG: phage holin family protein [Candidatus Staskawiczbacteria bacterium]|nr:phage holin family protein [Candidatus Staskawiczbacteria bacterium]
MVKKLVGQILASLLGLWLAVLFIPDVSIVLLESSNFFGISLNSIWQIYLILSVTLGFLNFFLKPLLNLITLPLRIITLGLFGFLINISFVWAIDIMFEEFSTPLVYPLLLTTFTISVLSIIFSIVLREE